MIWLKAALPRTRHVYHCHLLKKTLQEHKQLSGDLRMVLFPSELFKWYPFRLFFFYRKEFFLSFDVLKGTCLLYAAICFHSAPQPLQMEVEASLASSSLWSHGESWFGVYSFSDKMSQCTLGPEGSWWSILHRFWMWATPFPGRHHRTCVTCDEPNLVLFSRSFQCLSSTQDNVPSLEHTGIFSGNPQALRIDFWLKTGGRRQDSYPLRFCLKHHLFPPRVEAGRSQKPKPLTLLDYFLLFIYLTHLKKFFKGALSLTIAIQFIL